MLARSAAITTIATDYHVAQAIIACTSTDMCQLFAINTVRQNGTDGKGPFHITGLTLLGDLLDHSQIIPDILVHQTRRTRSEISRSLVVLQGFWIYLCVDKYEGVSEDTFKKISRGISVSLCRLQLISGKGR